jgi:hypothetical protein
VVYLIIETITQHTAFEEAARRIVRDGEWERIREEGVEGIDIGMRLPRFFHPCPSFSVIRSFSYLHRQLYLLLTVPDRLPRMQPNQPSQPTKHDRKPPISATSLPYPSASFTDHHRSYHLVFRSYWTRQGVRQVTDSPVVVSALRTLLPSHQQGESQKVWRYEGHSIYMLWLREAKLADWRGKSVSRDVGMTELPRAFKLRAYYTTMSFSGTIFCCFHSVPL